MEDFQRQQRINEYHARINRVVDYITRNLNQELSHERLADIACFSRFHFHRIFSAIMGETLGAFIKRVRVERAAGCLTGNPGKSITEIAFDCGFSGSAAFARAFRERFSMSASQFRREKPFIVMSNYSKPNSNDCKQFRKAGKDMEPDSAYPYVETFNERSDMLEVEIKNLPEIRVAYFRHIGPYELLSPVFDKLASWAGPRGLLSRPDTRVIAVYHDNPDITEKDKLRTSVCVTVPDEFKPEPESGVELMTIPGGKFAVASGELAIGEFEAAWNWFLGDWMPGSGWQPDDRICYEVYLNNHEDHPEKKFIIEIREPVRPL